MINQISLRVGDKVICEGKLFKVTRNPHNGYYGIRQVSPGTLGLEQIIHPSEIELLYTRQCMECLKDVMPDAEFGLCSDCQLEGVQL